MTRATALKLGFLALVGTLAYLFYPDPADTSGASAADCRITHVIDGDTVDLKCQGTQTERIRVMGYDTPETYYAKCDAEKVLGDRATAYLQALLPDTPVTRVERDRQDKYDRTLARIWLGGQDLADIMVAENLAVRYNGGQRINWCDRLADSGNN